jgi:hypothetical protein
MNSLGPGRKQLFLKKIAISCLLFSLGYIYTPDGCTESNHVYAQLLRRGGNFRGNSIW